MIKINEGFAPFSKTDWYGYAGAAKSKDGKFPQIAHSRNGSVDIIISPDDETERRWSIDIVTDDGYWRKSFNNSQSAIAEGKKALNVADNHKSVPMDDWCMDFGYKNIG